MILALTLLLFGRQVRELSS